MTEFQHAARQHGLLGGKGGLYGNAIVITPPLNVSAGAMLGCGNCSSRAPATANQR